MRTQQAWGTMAGELNIQRQCLDMMNSAWMGEYRSRGGEVFCRRGCSDCCSLAVNCTLPEAVALADSLPVRLAEDIAGYSARIREAVAGVTELKEYLRLQRSVMGMCPLLEADGVCSAYDQRPLSCRALLATKESRWCGVDFAQLGSDEKRAFVESLDRSVVAYPLHYAASPQETGRELEQRLLEVMFTTFGFSLYGSMPVLVHLVREHGLADAALSGRGAAERIADTTGFNHPFLMTFSGGESWPHQ